MTQKKPAKSRVETDALAATPDPILRRMLDDERVESQGLDTALLWRLLRYLRPHRALSALAVTLAVTEALLLTLPAYLIGLAIDRAALSSTRGAGGVDAAFSELGLATADLVGAGARSGAEAMIIGFGLLVALAWTLRWGIATGTTLLMQTLGQRIVHDLRVDVFEHITGMDAAYFHSNPVGRLVNRTTFDVQSISELFSDAFANGARDLLFIAVLMSVMVALDPPLALVLIGAFPLLVITALMYRRAARPALRTTSAVVSRMNSWLAENIAGMRENHLYRREAQRRSEFRALTEAHQRSVTHIIRAWGLLRPVMMMISAAATAVVLLLGYWRVTAGLVSVGVLLTFVQYTNRLWRPVRSLAEKFNLIQTSLTAGERVFDVLDTPSKLTDHPDADATLEVQRGAICFERVVFAYPNKPDAVVLRGIDFEAKPGEKIALIGDTGAGKSTITHLLSRFYDPDEGAVLIDGEPTHRYTLERLREGIALVPQDVVLFAGTLRDNITLGRDLPDAHLWDCLDAVNADFVRRFDDGLDHILEESGRTLSVGERQLLSFARALVINPPILVLDEATASIDTQTERRIQLALERLTHGRTSVVIAHRLSTIQDADCILVLRHGEIIERGRHDALLAANGEYARLHALHIGAESPPVVAAASSRIAAEPHAASL